MVVVHGTSSTCGTYESDRLGENAVRTSRHLHTHATHHGDEEDECSGVRWCVLSSVPDFQNQSKIIIMKVVVNEA